MGRRKKVDGSEGALTMTSKKANPDVFEGNEEEQLETLASEETELLDGEADEEVEAAPAKPKRQRRPRKKAEPKKLAVEGEASEDSQVKAEQGPTEIGAQTDLPAEVLPLPAMGGPVPQSVAEATVSSRVLNQMVNQITDSAGASTADSNALKKQLAAVKEVSVTICSQLDRMSAAMQELQSKHAAAIQDLSNNKSTGKAPAKTPVWLVATSGLALLLSIVSFSLSQATRHSVLGGNVVESSAKPSTPPVPSQLFGTFSKNAVAATTDSTVKSAVPGPRPQTFNRRAETDKKSSALAKKEGTSRRNHR